jgi:hypothetical protein
MYCSHVGLNPSMQYIKWISYRRQNLDALFMPNVSMEKVNCLFFIENVPFLVPIQLSADFSALTASSNPALWPDMLALQVVCSYAKFFIFL